MKATTPIIITVAGGFLLFQFWSLYGYVDEKPNSRPNFIIFFADDIGWGDLGANWKENQHVTPNLNKMAEMGMRLTDFHTGSSVCAPSRAALLTGRLGARTGLVTNFIPNSVGGLPRNETILAEVLKENGYRTGMIGKWHLGITEKYHPSSRGFDFYYGLPYSNDMGCVDVPTFNRPMCKPCAKTPSNNTSDVNDVVCQDSNTAVPLYKNRDIVEQPVDLINLGDHYAEKAQQFLSEASQGDEPFFLYVAFAHMHVPHAHAPRFTNSTDVKTVYADTLHEMDDVIGRILSTLHEGGKEDNTMIWFTGDNGPWQSKCEYGGNSGPFLGTWLTTTYGGGCTAKCTTWEAGHREPAIVVWPGHIKPNTTSDALLSSMDVFPTMLKSAGIEMPKYRKYDGIDVANVLQGVSTKAHDVLYHPNSDVTHPIGEIDTIRMGPYKIFWKTGGTGGTSRSCNGKEAPQVSHNPPLVFNLEKDQAESTPITAQTDPDYLKILESAESLRSNIIADIKADNTSKADYSTSPTAYPCCDSTKFMCRCKRDGYF
ncbi:arylsulfatase G-like [Styela clava]